MSIHRHDIIIVGGGLVGASLACALAPLGYRIAVLEAVTPRAAEQPSYDDRTLALGAASCHILAALGLWDELAPHATPIRRVHVADDSAPGRVTLDAEDMGLDCFGHVVEARQFGAAVLGAVHDLEQVEWLCPARAVDVNNDEKGVVIDAILEEGEHKRPLRLEASLLIAADGAQSGIRDLLGIGARTKAYDQTAIICNVTPGAHHEGQAWERLTRTGPFAVLPHQGDRCGLVWSVGSADAEALMALPDDQFLARAEARSRGILGEWKKVGRRTSYPLRQVVPERDSATRALILGNAAHAIHPVGAQGFNLGLRDIAVLAEVLFEANAQTAESLADPGSDDVIRAYSDWRAPDQRSTMGWTDDMITLFASDSLLTRGARTAAMTALALVPPLRRGLASRAMGYRGRIPKLALGQRLPPRQT